MEIEKKPRKMQKKYGGHNKQKKRCELVQERNKCQKVISINTDFDESRTSEKMRLASVNSNEGRVFENLRTDGG